MPTPKLDDKTLIEALNLIEEHGSGHNAVRAGATDLPRSTIERRAAAGRLKGLAPTFRKEAPRIRTQQRLGRMHMVIPDTQQKPGVCMDHMEWAGNFAVEKRPDVIIHIGDHWDMPSLSSYDKGKLQYEKRRYIADVEAGRRSMIRFLTPIQEYNRTHPKTPYHPAFEYCEGNHDQRVRRVAEENPEFEGKISIADLGIEEMGWNFHPFLKVLKVDGVEYAHYFTSGAMGRPVTSAAALLRERQCSATMGHVQYTDHAIHKKTCKRAMFCGTFYMHDEEYLGQQGNSQRRQIIIKHEVQDGFYDLMEVSLNFLKKAYS
jgi:hypothetical protein